MSSFTVANEFAEVDITVVRFGNGERLEIRSRRWGTNVWLDPIELEALTWQSKQAFSQMLEASVRPA